MPAMEPGRMAKIKLIISPDGRNEFALGKKTNGKERNTSQAKMWIRTCTPFLFME